MVNFFHNLKLHLKMNISFSVTFQLSSSVSLFKLTPRSLASQSVEAPGCPSTEWENQRILAPLQNGLSQVNLAKKPE